ncbi:MAG: hypothetical protein KGH49_02415 [Candidatus Micrarchaeota archaeon]|nr:hypothetical protein [Candidatus Micrarchaeota archaeon]
MERKHLSKKLQRAEKLKKGLERVAFASLFFDIAIAVVTLITINFGRMDITDELILLFNYALTVIVVISIGIFVMMLLVRHYQRIVDIALMRGRKRHGQ